MYESAGRMMEPCRPVLGTSRRPLMVVEGGQGALFLGCCRTFGVGKVGKVPVLQAVCTYGGAAAAAAGGSGGRRSSRPSLPEGHAAHCTLHTAHSYCPAPHSEGPLCLHAAAGHLHSASPRPPPAGPSPHHYWRACGVFRPPSATIMARVASHFLGAALERARPWEHRPASSTQAALVGLQCHVLVVLPAG